MGKISILIPIMLWLISFAVLIFVVAYDTTDALGWLGVGVCFGFAFAQTIDTVREHFYYKKFHNFREG